MDKLKDLLKKEDRDAADAINAYNFDQDTSAGWETKPNTAERELVRSVLRTVLRNDSIAAQLRWTNPKELKKLIKHWMKVFAKEKMGDMLWAAGKDESKIFDYVMKATGGSVQKEEKDLYHTPVKATTTRREFDKMYSWLEDMNSFKPVKKELNFIMANPNTFKTWDDFHDAVMGAVSKYEQLSKKKMPNDIQDILLRHIESELEYYG